MNRLIWLPIPLLVAITLIGCGRTAEVVPSPPPAAPTVKAGPAPTAPILQGYPPIYFGLAANEELIAISDTIARVEMLGMTTSTILANPTRLFDRTGWSVNMEFRLRVHEYLKGSGPNEIVAMVTQGRFGTEAEALDWLPTLVAVPDVSWNDREAIVFMNSSWLGHPSIGEAADRFHIGGIIVGGEDAYTLSSRHSRRWLPEARQSGGANGRSVRASDKRFLLDVPTGSGVGTRSTSTSEVDLAPTIDIAEMKKLIAHVEAVASTSVMHRECIRLKYSFLRSREQLGHDIINHRTTAYAMVSGQPAGTVVHESREGYVLSPTNTGRTWFEGADKDLVEVEFSDFAHNTESSVVGELSYYRATESLVTTRPLPAGTYRYRYHAIWGQELLCGDETDSEQFIYDTHLTVTASPRPVHEAFFDPVAIGAAVGADGTSGVLKPAAFTGGGASATITGLEWESGGVTMELSPSASLAGHAVDFIALDGSVSLTLSFDAATQSGGALTWTVASQPWNAGDLLMLRIRSTNVVITPPTATPTPTPTAAPTATPTATPTPAATPTPTPTPMATPTPTPTPTPTSTPTPTTTEPVTVTLIPRVDGLTFFDIDIQWSHAGTCDNYYVAIITDADYQISFLGFHPPETSSHYVQGSWLYNNVPDFWVVVECRASGDSQEVGRASLRAAHPDNN